LRGYLLADRDRERVRAEGRMMERARLLGGARGGGSEGGRGPGAQGAAVSLWSARVSVWYDLGFGHALVPLLT
jgi:hypothetical protein